MKPLPRWSLNITGGYSIKSYYSPSMGLAYNDPKVIECIDRVVLAMCSYPDAQKVLDRMR